MDHRHSAGLIGLETRKNTATASDAMKLCGRLTAAGYKLRPLLDTAEFAGRHREHAARIAAIADHLGTAAAVNSHFFRGGLAQD